MRQDASWGTMLARGAALGSRTGTAPNALLQLEGGNLVTDGLGVATIASRVRASQGRYFVVARAAGGALSRLGALEIVSTVQTLKVGGWRGASEALHLQLEMPSDDAGRTTIELPPLQVHSVNFMLVNTFPSNRSNRRAYIGSGSVSAGRVRRSQ